MVIQSNVTIPNELWAYFKDDYTISTPFQTHSQYTTSVLAVMKKNEFKAIEKAVKSLETTEEIPSTNQNFIEEFFHVCLYIYRKPNLYERLSINKTSFNHSFIWLIMEFVVNSMPDMSLKFSPAEYILSVQKKSTRQMLVYQLMKMNYRF